MFLHYLYTDYNVAMPDVSHGDNVLTHGTDW